MYYDKYNLDCVYNSGIQPNNLVYRILFSNQFNGNDGHIHDFLINSTVMIVHIHDDIQIVRTHS